MMPEQAMHDAQHADSAKMSVAGNSEEPTSGFLSRTMCTRKGEVVCVTPHAGDERTEVTVIGRLDDGRVIAEYLDSDGELLFLTGVSYEADRR